MKVTRFDRDGELIVVPARLWGQAVTVRKVGNLSGGAGREVLRVF